MREEDNPFLQNRARARARHTAESRYRQALSAQRVKQNEYDQDRKQLIEHPTRMRDKYKVRVDDLERQIVLYQKALESAKESHQKYLEAAEAGEEVFKDKWTLEAVEALSEPIPEPPVILDLDALPTAHVVSRNG